MDINIQDIAIDHIRFTYLQTWIGYINEKGISKAQFHPYFITPLYASEPFVHNICFHCFGYNGFYSFMFFSLAPCC